ncbi:hypothetical protein JTB14_003589 [Gonioctena quinquepunctata]|nr:hypothetical protein JTB14_003589 [Gonioctena quinquepunctata]
MQEIQNILHQLPEPALIMGDFNAHSPLWGSETRDSRGRRIEILLEQENICLANSGEATHFNARSNSFPSIDLTLCTPQIIPALTWKPLEDLHSSDHFPIQINFDIPERNRTPGEKWLIKKANWDVFSSLVSLPNPDLFEEINDAVDAATNAILLAAHSAIPKAMSKGSSKSVPWWNESIKLAITSRNKALRVFRRNPSTENLIEFKKRRSFARRIINESRKRSWEEYVSSLTADTPVSELWKKIKIISGKNSYINPKP